MIAEIKRKVSTLVGELIVPAWQLLHPVATPGIFCGNLFTTALICSMLLHAVGGSAITIGTFRSISLNGREL
jgi:hypothetical protein